MLSENIATLRQHFLKYSDTGLVIAPTAVCRISDMLLTMALDAVALENSLISPVAMAPTDLPDNVVPMAPRSAGGSL